MSEQTLYDRLGGEAGLQRLVARFYDLMHTLPEARIVRELHPRTLDRSRENLFKFLSGWFGGPPLYIRERGHPRLRMRHLPFRIGPDERDAWMLCMSRALAEQVEDPALRQGVERAFAEMADHMINVAPAEPEEPDQAVTGGPR